MAWHGVKEAQAGRYNHINYNTIGHINIIQQVNINRNLKHIDS
jgi:hypothetical protein